MQTTKKINNMIVVTMFLLVGVTTDAFAQSRRSQTIDTNLCSNDAPITSVKLATAPTKYIKTQDARSLTAMHNSGRGVTLGLAGGPISITINGQFQTRSINDKACVELKKLEVLFWAKPEVLIASNFKKGSCEYREVLGHEQKHIRVLRNFVREQAPLLKKEVKKIVSSSRTQYKVKEQNVEKAQKEIEKQIFSRLEAHQNKIMPILQSRQTAIDSPEEYARVAAKCKNWGKKLSGR